MRNQNRQRRGARDVTKSPPKNWQHQQTANALERALEREKSLRKKLTGFKNLTRMVGKKRMRRGHFKPNPGFHETQCRRAAEKASARFLRGELGAGKRLRKADAMKFRRDIRALQRELKEAKADALDSLNNQAEVISELQARAVPEGWEIRTLSSDGWRMTINRIDQVRAVGARVTKWRWSVASTRKLRNGIVDSIKEAVQQAEKAGKKVRR